MEFRELIILDDEGGDKLEFELLDRITYENQAYAVLSALGEDEGALVILLAEQDPASGETFYDEVEDEQTLMAVFQLFKDRHPNEFEFTD